MSDLRIRAAVFDLDGTLTDTLKDISEAMNFALRSFGLPEWETDDYRYLVGDGVIKLAEQLGLKPEDFVYFGDTATDMICARQAGMHPVGVLWGFRSAEELTESGAEILISHPDEFRI